MESYSLLGDSLLVASVVAGLLHGHGSRVPGALLRSRLLVGLEKTEKAVLEHFELFVICGGLKIRWRVGGLD
jgi:hypothetical protein